MGSKFPGFQQASMHSTEIRHTLQWTPVSLTPLLQFYSCWNYLLGPVNWMGRPFSIPLPFRIQGAGATEAGATTIF